jgi:hypothetical protein
MTKAKLDLLKQAHTDNIASGPASKGAKKRGRKRSPVIESYLDRIKSLIPGKQSCFFPGAKRADLEFLRKPCKTEGLRIMIREVECDEIYCGPGVRLYREEGEYDEL